MIGKDETTKKTSVCPLPIRFEAVKFNLFLVLYVYMFVIVCFSLCCFFDERGPSLNIVDCC